MQVTLKTIATGLMASTLFFGSQVVVADNPGGQQGQQNWGQQGQQNWGQQGQNGGQQGQYWGQQNGGQQGQQQNWGQQEGQQNGGQQWGQQGQQQWGQQQNWGQQEGQQNGGQQGQQQWGLQQQGQQQWGQQQWRQQQWGQQLYLRAGCQGCHGPNGNTPEEPGYPKLAGQDMSYLVNQIRAILYGTRTNNMSSKMAQHMPALLNDNQIQAIAAWLSSLGAYSKQGFNR